MSYFILYLFEFLENQRKKRVIQKQIMMKDHSCVMCVLKDFYEKMHLESI